MSDLPLTVTADDLRAARWSMAMHLNMGSQGHQYAYTSPTFPEATVSKGWSKEKGRRVTWAEVRVSMGGDRVEAAPLGDLDEAARLISKARQLIADDRAWEAAEPSKRGAA